MWKEEENSGAVYNIQDRHDCITQLRLFANICTGISYQSDIKAECMQAYTIRSIVTNYILQQVRYCITFEKSNVQFVIHNVSE